MTDRIPLDAMTSDALDQLHQRAETAEQRLRLAHQARRAKEHQLDGIRRALCDIGAIQDDDPYSHADLEDVIRQLGHPDVEQAARVRAACERLRRASVLADGHPHTDRERGVIQAITRILTALDARPADDTTPGPAATQATEPARWLFAGTRDLSIPDTTKEN